MIELWTKVARWMAKRLQINATAEPEDLVQSCLLALIELGENPDPVDVVWAMRDAVRGQYRQQTTAVLGTEFQPIEEMTCAGYDRNCCYLGDVWIEPDQEVDQAYLESIENGKDAFEDRLREAYPEGDMLEAAILASKTDPWRSIELEEHLRAEEAEASLAEDTISLPIYLQEYQPDEALVERAIDSVVAGSSPLRRCVRANFRRKRRTPAEEWADLIEWKAVEAVKDCVSTAVKEAELELPTPVEWALLAVGLARRLTDARLRRDRGLFYGAVKEGVTRLFEEEWLEDEKVMAILWPEAQHEESIPGPELKDIDELLDTIEARCEPEDVSHTIQGGLLTYTGWNIWDTKEARQAQVRAALNGASWKDATMAGREAFFATPGHRKMMRRNYAALEAAGLRREKSMGYKVVPGPGLVVKKLYRDGVQTPTGRQPFASGQMFVVPEMKKESFIRSLAETDLLYDFTVVGV